MLYYVTDSLYYFKQNVLDLTKTFSRNFYNCNYKLSLKNLQYQSQMQLIFLIFIIKN